MNQSKCDLVERQLREREQKLIMDSMKTLSKAEEMNKSLSNQLQVSQKEVSLAQKKKEATQKEVIVRNGLEELTRGSLFFMLCVWLS